MVQGASRAMMFGGGHLQIRYNSAVFASDEAACSHSLKVVSAIAKLPLMPDDLTPVYLPNLAVARSQLSVVPSTEGDTDEDILWYWDQQLDLTNMACTVNGPGGTTDCFFTKTTGICHTSGGESSIGFEVAGAFAHFGRTELMTRIKVKRRLKEREALFLLTEYVNGGGQPTGDVNVWPIRRNVYFRYAVRPSR